MANSDDRIKLWRDLRKRLGFTQSKLAKKFGMALRGIQDLEGGHNPVKAVHMLALLAVNLREQMHAAFITCVSDEPNYYVKVKFKTLAEAQDFHQAIIRLNTIQLEDN